MFPVTGLGPPGAASVSSATLQCSTVLLQCKPTQRGVLQSRQELTPVRWKELATEISSLHNLGSS